MWFTGIQATLSAILVLATSYIGNAIGADGWYYLGAGLSAVVFMVSIWACPETKYERPISAYQGEATRVTHFIQTKDSESKDDAVEIEVLDRVTTTQIREFDLVKYKPRTLASDMRILLYKPDWEEAWRCLKGMVQVMLFPNIFWAFLINGVTM